MANSQFLSVSEDEDNPINDNYLDEVAVDLDRIVRRVLVVLFIMIGESVEFRSSDVLDSGVPPQDPRESVCCALSSL